jgi:hypothetical protein
LQGFSTKFFIFFIFFNHPPAERKLPIVTAYQPIAYRFRGAELCPIRTDFQRYTCKSAVNQFATIARILNSALESETDEAAAEKSCDEIDKFLREIGMWLIRELSHLKMLPNCSS